VYTGVYGIEMRFRKIGVNQELENALHSLEEKLEEKEVRPGRLFFRPRGEFNSMHTTKCICLAVIQSS